MILAAGLAGWDIPAVADSLVTVPARAATYRPQFRAYGKVVPIQSLKIQAGIDGVLEGLAVVPGQRVKAGDVIARIGGPDQVEAVSEAQAKVAAARQVLASASDKEQSVQRLYPGLADRSRLDRAKTGLADARAQLADATAELTRLQALSTITSPANGTVVSLQAADGDRVAPGSPVLLLQPTSQLWLQAIFYDVPPGLLTPGHRGTFRPADGSDPVPVRLAHAQPALREDGGLPVTFIAASPAAHWRLGESGELRIEGMPRRVVAVPNEALVLDNGRWWVLEKNPKGLRHVPVQPGPSRGDETLVLEGLRPGALVVVQDAYLLFHRDFGQHYAPPD